MTYKATTIPTVSGVDSPWSLRVQPALGGAVMLIAFDGNSPVWSGTVDVELLLGALVGASLEKREHMHTVVALYRHLRDDHDDG